MDGVWLDQRVSELAHSHPRWVGVLEQRGIDCCRGSDRSLAKACQQAGIDSSTLWQELQMVDRFQQSHAECDWNDRSLQSLVSHIVDQHHSYVRQTLASLGTLARKVAQRHRGGKSKYQELVLLLAALETELTSHMRKEEAVLFPWICQLEATKATYRMRCGTLQNPIQVMEDEHHFAVQTLARVRWLADDFQAPADACPTLRGYYLSLADFERDLYQHIHEEQDILFPRAIELEAACMLAN